MKPTRADSSSALVRWTMFDFPLYFATYRMGGAFVLNAKVDVSRNSIGIKFFVIPAKAGIHLLPYK